MATTRKPTPTKAARASAKRAPAKPPVEPNHAEINASVWGQYKTARAAIKQWTEVMTKARAQIEQAMADNEHGDIAGTTVVKWEYRKSHRLNQAKLKKAHPDLVAEFTEASEARYFTPVEDVEE